MRRVAVIGLDSAEWTLMEPLMLSGDMPFLASLREQSAEIHLENRGPIGRVWESFLMGRHIPHDMWEFVPSSYSTFWLGARPDPAFYTRASEDLKVLSFEVPFQSLYQNVPGIQVVNWAGHNAGYPRASSPMGVLGEIDERFGPPAPFTWDEPEWYDDEAVAALGQRMAASIEQRTQVIEWLLDRCPDWDLVLSVFPESHEISEVLWHAHDPTHPLHQHPSAAVAKHALTEAHHALDVGIKAIAEALPEDAVLMVVALHGAQGNVLDVPTMGLLPELLYRWNFSRPFIEVDLPSDPLIVPPPGKRWEDLMWSFRVDQERPGIKERLAGAISKISKRRSDASVGGVTDEASAAEGPLYPPETDRSPVEIGRPRESTDRWVAAWYKDHWPNMRAFVTPSIYEGRIRLNVIGREASGRVSQSEYLDVLDQVESLLMECRDPRTGRCPVDSIVRTAEDPLAVTDREVDLTVMWKGYVDRLEHPKVGTVGPVPYRRTGGHSTRGFALVTGKGIERSVTEGIDARDIPPTVLSILGLPTPQEVDGEAVPLRG